MRDIAIEFTATKALDGVNLRPYEGEIHALMGQTGAGMLSLVKALAGTYRIDSGDILVSGKPGRLSGRAEAQSAGIAAVYQEVDLCDNLTIGENIMIGHEVRGWSGINWRATHLKASETLTELGLVVLC